MSKKAKSWLIAAVCLIAVGVAVFTTVYGILGWDFKQLDLSEFQTETFEISEDFDDIHINSDAADIIFAPSDDGKCRIDCYERKDDRHFAESKDGILYISSNDKEKWYNNIGFNLKSAQITVFLPKEEYKKVLIANNTGSVQIPSIFKFETADISVTTGNVEFFASTGSIKIAATTGDIRTENIFTQVLDISVTTGKAVVSNITCKCLNSDGITGDIILKNVTASESISMIRTTGNIYIADSDAPEIFINTTTGDVKGSFLSDKVFSVKTTTGNVKVPKSISGGSCKVTTTTGDVILE